MINLFMTWRDTCSWRDVTWYLFMTCKLIVLWIPNRQAKIFLPKPIVYRRYVDDIFVHFSSKEHIQPFVDYINKQHRCIKCTTETEKNNTVSFLDINITCQNNQLWTSVYRKPIFTGVFTHYESYIDQSYKKP